MLRWTRRGLTMAALVPAGLLAGPLGALAQPDPSRAVAFVDTTGRELTAAINDTGMGPDARRAKVASILRRAVDVEGVGRFILGQWWRNASPAEQQEYVKLFDETLVRNLAARFGEYQGVRFNLGRAQARAEDDVLVNTVIQRPNSPSFALDWRVAELAGGPRVVDVYAEGTSLRRTQRSEYNAVVQRNGGKIGPLLEAMRGQIAQLAAREQVRR